MHWPTRQRGRDSISKLEHIIVLNSTFLRKLICRERENQRHTSRRTDNTHSQRVGTYYNMVISDWCN